jgi:hypothetical protein
MNERKFLSGRAIYGTTFWLFLFSESYFAVGRFHTAVPRRSEGNLAHIYQQEQLCPRLSQHCSYNGSILRYLRKIPCLSPTLGQAFDHSIAWEPEPSYSLEFQQQSWHRPGEETHEIWSPSGLDHIVASTHASSLYYNRRDRSWVATLIHCATKQQFGQLLFLVWPSISISFIYYVILWYVHALTKHIP